MWDNTLVVPYHKYLHVFGEPAFDHKVDRDNFYFNVPSIEDCDVTDN